jgi:hypothetical protein
MRSASSGRETFSKLKKHPKGENQNETMNINPSRSVYCRYRLCEHGGGTVVAAAIQGRHDLLQQCQRFIGGVIVQDGQHDILLWFEWSAGRFGHQNGLVIQD